MAKIKSLNFKVVSSIYLQICCMNYLGCWIYLSWVAYNLNLKWRNIYLAHLMTFD